MKCPICGSPVKNELSSIKRMINGNKIWINNVPSMNCTNLACGQIILEGDTVDLMRQLLDLVKHIDLENNIHVTNSTIDFLKIEEVLNELAVGIEVAR